ATNMPASRAGPARVVHHRLRCIATSAAPRMTAANTSFSAAYVQRSSGPPSTTVSASAGRSTSSSPAQSSTTPVSASADIPAAGAAVAEARREGVAHQHHVADLADLGEPRPPGRSPGEAAVAHEPGRVRVADEDRRNGQLQLVGQVARQELGVYGAAALDHQP